MSKPNTAVIGIDLGTTYCCVAVMKNEKIEVIANHNGQRTTPSCVNFEKGEKLVGENDRTRGTTVYDQKRLIGRKFTDINVRNRLNFWSFSIVERSGKPAVHIKDNGNSKYYYPEEISAMILEYLKKIASEYIGGEITGAVVTVPAYFNISQREATKDAGKIAGLNILRIINEPTAAAIAVYGLQSENADDESFNVLVYDLGGGTFDVSILSIDGSFMEVKATGGDNNLGGEDFNNRMVQYFVDDIVERHSINLFKNKKALRRLQNQCEKAKKILSQPAHAKATIELDSIHGNIDYDSEISRAKFDSLNVDLFEKTLDVIKFCLKDAEMEKDEIRSVVLVGGSTRIMFIRKMIEDFFGDQIEIKTSQNPDETVAIGAALHASKLSPGDNILPPIERLLVIDVTPLSLGIETLGGKMSVIIPRNSPIPRSAQKKYANQVDQSQVRIAVYQGERQMVSDNYELGSFVLNFDGIQGRKEDLQIEVTFNVDPDGTLKVLAREENTNISDTLSLSLNGRLDDDEIQQIIQEADRNRREDAKKRIIIDAKVDLESECFNTKKKLERHPGVNEDAKTAIRTKCDDLREWLEKLKMNDQTLDKIKQRKNDLQKHCKKVGLI